MYKEYPVHVTVTGKFVAYNNNFVWIQLGGCGESDSHQLPFHNTEHLEKLYKNKLVRLRGTRAWENATNKWGYSWTVHPVNLWEQGMENAPEDIKKLCGTNC